MPSKLYTYQVSMALIRSLSFFFVSSLFSFFFFLHQVRLILGQRNEWMLRGNNAPNCCLRRRWFLWLLYPSPPQISTRPCRPRNFCWLFESNSFRFFPIRPTFRPLSITIVFVWIFEDLFRLNSSGAPVESTLDATESRKLCVSLVSVRFYFLLFVRFETFLG